MPQLILASGSPRRKELLARLGIPFVICPPSCGEKIIAKDSPEQNVIRLARQKTENVFKSNRNAAVLGCDTLVSFKKEILGKPRDPSDSLSILRKLNGHKHIVLSGICLMYGQQILCDAVSTEVHFGKFSDEILQCYAACGEGNDKAGAYAIQGIGAFLVDKINGSPTNVIGLPLLQTSNMLQKIGYKLFSQVFYKNAGYIYKSSKHTIKKFRY